MLTSSDEHKGSSLAALDCPEGLRSSVVLVHALKTCHAMRDLLTPGSKPPLPSAMKPRETRNRPHQGLPLTNRTRSRLTSSFHGTGTAYPRELASP